MSMQNLFNEFIGSSGDNTKNTIQNTAGNAMEKISGGLPGGLMGGAAAGGVLALLMNNKKARKFTGKAATYGGAAMLGGLAYKAYKNWSQGESPGVTTAAGSAEMNQPTDSDAELVTNDTVPADLELRLIKTMIAAAKADGHIDQQEQLRIMNTVGEMNTSSEINGMVFNLLSEDISVDENTQGLHDMAHKSEIYLGACLVIDLDHPDEEAFLTRLEKALDLPDSLAQEIRWQAQESMNEAA